MQQQMNPGRRVDHSKNRSFQLPDLDPLIVQTASRRWPRFYPPLDQGREGTCVGHGWKHWALTTPVVQTKPALEPTAVQIYLAAQARDGFGSTPGDMQAGTSVVAGALAMREFGFLQEFKWAYNTDQLIKWIGGKNTDGKFVGGPAVLGTNFYDSMYEVDSGGFWTIPTFARTVGGHCYAADEVNVEKEYFEGPNSWGYKFGRFVGVKRNGRWRISFANMERLLHEDGEACMATEVKRVKVV